MALINKKKDAYLPQSLQLHVNQIISHITAW